MTWTIISRLVLFNIRCEFFRLVMGLIWDLSHLILYEARLSRISGWCLKAWDKGIRTVLIISSITSAATCWKNWISSIRCCFIVVLLHDKIIIFRCLRPFIPSIAWYRWRVKVYFRCRTFRLMFICRKLIYYELCWSLGSSWIRTWSWVKSNHIVKGIRKIFNQRLYNLSFIFRLILILSSNLKARVFIFSGRWNSI